MEEKKEIDYESMSLAELEKEIEKIPKTQEKDSKSVETEEIEKEVAIEENTKEEETNKEEVNEEKKELKEDINKEDIDEKIFDNPFYKPFKGKSKIEMLEILRNNATYVSQKDNENYRLKTELESLKSKVQQDDDEDFESYDKKDIAVIEKVITRTLEKKEKELQMQKNAEIEVNKKANEEYFELIKKNDSEFVESITNKLVDEIRKDINSTLYSKNWVLNYYIKEKNKIVTKESKPDITKKKQAATISGNNSIQTVKSENEMTADEWLDERLRKLKK